MKHGSTAGSGHREAELCHGEEEDITVSQLLKIGTDFGTLHLKNIRTYEKIREDSRRGRIAETRINTGFEKF